MKLLLRPIGWIALCTLGAGTFWSLSVTMGGEAVIQVAGWIAGTAGVGLGGMYWGTRHRMLDLFEKWVTDPDQGQTATRLYGRNHRTSWRLAATALLSGGLAGMPSFLSTARMETGSLVLLLAGVGLGQLVYAALIYRSWDIQIKHFKSLSLQQALEDKAREESILALQSAPRPTYARDWTAGPELEPIRHH